MERSIWRTAQRAAVRGIVILAVLAALAYAYRRYSLQELDAPLAPADGVNEGHFVNIGGIDQWVTIRGRDRHNPLLLLLHGGPGNAFQSFTRVPIAEWERVFTIAQWDQRGAGRTFGRSGPVGDSVTLDRMALDAAEVADYARKTVD